MAIWLYGYMAIWVYGYIEDAMRRDTAATFLGQAILDRASQHPSDLGQRTPCRGASYVGRRIIAGATAGSAEPGLGRAMQFSPLLSARLHGTVVRQCRRPRFLAEA